MTKKADTFCIVPWIGAVVAPDKENLICCRANDTPIEYSLDIVNTATHTHLRKVLGEGIKDPICKRCWSDEAASIPSYRQSYNNSYRDLIASDAYTPAKLRFLELTPSNTCNLACRMCSSRYSSKIVAREKHLVSLNLMEEREKAHFTNWRDLDLTHLQELKLMGGEPMYLKEHLELLNYLDQIDILKNLSIMLITNCTQDLTERWKYLLTKAKHTHISMSIDGVGEINNYIRQYSNWNVIEKNIKNFVNLKNANNNINFGVNSTVGIYNVNKTKELEDYMKERNIECYFNPLKYPEYQSLHYISDENKKYFLHHSGVTDKVKHVLMQSSEKIVPTSEFIEQTSAVDEFYKKYLKEYNSEIYNLFNIN